MQIRYTIFSRLLCVRHLQTILPYSPYLYGIFAFYSNFSPLPEFTFAKRKVFWLNWNLLFQFTSASLSNNFFEFSYLHFPSPPFLCFSRQHSPDFPWLSSYLLTPRNKKTCIRKAISAKRCRFVGCEPSRKSEKSLYSLSLLLIIRFSTSFATGPADAYPVPPFLIHTTKANG